MKEEEKYTPEKDGRLKTLNPSKMYHSRTQEYAANAALRGNLIDPFDGYLMNEIKFNSPRVSMDDWVIQQKKDNVQRVRKLAKFMQVDNITP
jgi:hypothetical protein